VHTDPPRTNLLLLLLYFVVKILLQFFNSLLQVLILVPSLGRYDLVTRVDDSPLEVLKCELPKNAVLAF